MEDCLLCPKNHSCRGQVISDLVLKLFDAVEHASTGRDVDTISKALSREDMKSLTVQGETAHVMCWSKGFVWVLARKVADLSKVAQDDEDLRRGIERLVTSIDCLFGKLPKGQSIDLPALIMDVYNRVTQILAIEGCTAVVPATILGKAITEVARRRVGLITSGIGYNPDQPS